MACYYKVYQLAGNNFPSALKLKLSHELFNKNEIIENKKMGKLTLQNQPQVNKEPEKPGFRFTVFLINYVKANQEAIQTWLSWRIVF